MFPHRDSRLTKIVLTIFFILILVYGVYEAQGLLFGPKIEISTESTVVHDPYVKIDGKAARISSLSMNGKAVPVTESGEFSVPFLLARGNNRISLEAKDTYGRTTSSYVEIMYIPDPLTGTVSTTTSNFME